jgi:hypothetical protein
MISDTSKPSFCSLARLDGEAKEERKALANKRKSISRGAVNSQFSVAAGVLLKRTK